MRDFYATAAQVFPVLMLALIWESSFLDRLRKQQRAHRRDGPGGVWFWTKRRVRVWTIFIITVATLELALTLLILAGAFEDSITLRSVVIAGLALVLGSLLTRAVADTIDATRQ